MINYYQIQEKLARQIKKIMHFPFVNGMFVNWSNGFNVIPVSNSSFNAYVGYFCMQYLYSHIVWIVKYLLSATKFKPYTELKWSTHSVKILE